MLGYIFLLLIVGLILLFVEALVPGGLVGALGVGSILFSAYLMGEEYGVVTGSIYLGCSAIASLALAFWSFHFFARRLRLTPQKSMEADVNELRLQIGNSATVVSDLRPTGSIQIDSKRFSAQANVSHQVIEKGAIVHVIRVNGNDLVVEANEDK